MTEQLTQHPAPLPYEIVELAGGVEQYWFKLPGKSVFMFEKSEKGTAYAWSSRLSYSECYHAWESLWKNASSLEASGMQKSGVGIYDYAPRIDTQKDLVGQFIVDSNDASKSTAGATCTWWHKDYNDSTSIKWDTLKYEFPVDSQGSVEFIPGALFPDEAIVDLLHATATQEIVDNADYLLHI